MLCPWLEKPKPLWRVHEFYSFPIFISLFISLGWNSLLFSLIPPSSRGHSNRIVVKKQEKLEKTKSVGYMSLFNTKIVFQVFPPFSAVPAGEMLTHPAISYQGAIWGFTKKNECSIPGMGSGKMVLDLGFIAWRSPEWILRGAMHVGRKNLDPRPTATALGAGRGGHWSKSLGDLSWFSSGSPFQQWTCLLVSLDRCLHMVPETMAVRSLSGGWMDPSGRNRLYPGVCVSLKVRPHSESRWVAGQ